MQGVVTRFVVVTISAVVVEGSVIRVVDFMVVAGSLVIGGSVTAVEIVGEVVGGAVVVWQGSLPNITVALMQIAW